MVRILFTILLLVGTVQAEPLDSAWKMVDKVLDQCNVDSAGTTLISRTYVLRCVDQAQQFVATHNPACIKHDTVALVVNQFAYDLPSDFFYAPEQRSIIMAGLKTDSGYFRLELSPPYASDVEPKPGAKPFRFYNTLSNYMLYPAPSSGLIRDTIFVDYWAVPSALIGETTAVDIVDDYRQHVWLIASKDVMDRLGRVIESANFQNQYNNLKSKTATTTTQTKEVIE